MFTWKLLFGERGGVLVWEMDIFLLLVCPKGIFGGRCRSVHTWWGNKQDESRQNIFGKMENSGGIILGDNSVGYCFVLRDSIPMKFFKKVMIMKVKMCTTGKICGKLCLKAIRHTFFQHLVCNQGRNGVRHEGKGEDSIFWWVDSEPSPLPPLVANPDPP